MTILAANPDAPTSPGAVIDDEPRPDWLTTETWPHPILRLVDGDRSLAYTDVGTGPTLLLVHTGMWSFVWRDVIAPLAASFRVVTLDAPGNGMSAGPRRVTLADAADAIDTLVRHLDLDDFVLAFHDLGGVASLTAAAQWPERIRAVVAINSFGWRPGGVAFRGMLRLMGAAPMREIGAWTGWLVRASSGRFGAGRRWDRPTRRTFRRGFDRPRRRNIHRYLRDALDHEYEPVDRAVAALADRPLLTAFGERNDPLGFQPRWAERFADHTRVVVRAGNHFPMGDDPELVADSLLGWFHSRVDGRPRPPGRLPDGTQAASIPGIVERRP